MDCVFCAIAEGKIAADVVAETELAVAFRDRSPVAPTHVLVVPRKHIPSVDAMTRDDGHIASDLLQLCSEVARREGITDAGYRVLTNVGDDAGQTVHHVHFHVIGGRRLGEMG